jgi:sec-independent protein translocase protein TatA
MFGGRIGAPEIIVLAVLLIVIFGWKRLPDAARSLGRSARVFKSEVDEMKKDNASAASTETVRGEALPPARPASAAPVVDPVDDTARSDGNAVHENVPRTDNRPGPAA